MVGKKTDHCQKFVTPVYDGI